MSDFPYQYGHRDRDAWQGEIHFPTGVGMRGFWQHRDMEGRPGAGISFMVRDKDGPERTITFLVEAPMVGLLLGFITAYGNEAGLSAYLGAEADRTAAELRRLTYPFMSGADDD